MKLDIAMFNGGALPSLCQEESPMASSWTRRAGVRPSPRKSRISTTLKAGARRRAAECMSKRAP
eukprot:scaffold275301_cov28-Tisochrysis_lutea.AAC.4